MRTVYQSKMFHFFQAGETKAMVKNFDDMAKRGFKFYSTAFTEDSLTGKLKYPET